ncbi:MAG: Uma2 family endonuclease [Herpetosiphonaceae bacterium]|nr:Uma2 family endonuclease [Herpetosiphonaceae bacterium]
MATHVPATIEDLYQMPKHTKAEIIDGAVVAMSPTGFWPSRASGEIYASLRDYERQTKAGYAIPDNAGFIVNLPNRLSFSPDAAFYTGPLTGMKFLEGAPVFAAEVRSAGDYGPQAEREIVQKRADYFAAGALVVWDVDLLGEDVVRVYRLNEPDKPVVYRRDELTEAEPAVPGWTMAVNDLFT